MATADLLIAIKAVDQASASLNNVSTSLGKMGQTAGQSAPGFGSMAAAVGVGTVAATGLIAAASALATGLHSAVSTAADFGQSMANIKATVPKAEFEAFGQQTQALAMRLGKDYPLSAADAGKAMELLAQKGISLEAINNGAAEAVVQLSAATGSDLVTAAGIAAVTMDVFKVKESDMNRVTDLMTGAMLRGGVSARDFGYAIQAGGTAVALAGGTIDDASIAIAAMAKAGIEGSDAGTSLKTMYMNLIPATKGQIAVAKELGLVTADGTNQFFDASGKVKSYEEISKVLATSLEGLTEKQKLSALETLFGSDAIRAASVSAQFGSGAFGNLGAAIREPGIAADAAKTKMDSLSGQMQQLGGSVETLSLKVGNQLAPYLQRAAAVATDFVNRLIDMADNIDLAPALDAVGSALSTLSNYVYDAGQAASEFGEMLGGIPVIGELLNRYFQVAGSELTALAAIMRGDGAGAAEALGQAFTDLGTFVQDAANLITGTVTTISDAWAAIVAATQASYDAAVAVITGAWDAVTSLTTTAMEAVTGAITAGWSAAIDGETVAAMANLQSAVSEAWGVVVAVIGEALGSVLSSVSETWSAVASAVGEAMGAANAVVAEMMGSILGVVSDVGGSVVGAAGDFMGGVVEAVGDAAGAAAGAAADVGWSIVEGLRGALNAGISGIANGAAGLVRAAINAARAEADARSPSRKMFALGVDMMTGLDQGIRSKPITSAAESVERSIDGVRQELTGLSRDANTTGTALDGLTFKLRTTDSVDPVITIADNVATESARIATFSGQLANLEAQDPSITVSAPGLSTVQANVDTLWSRLGQVAAPVAIGFSANVPTAVSVTAINTGNLAADAASVAGNLGVSGSATLQNSSINGVNTLDAGHVNAQGAELHGIGNVETGDVDMGDVDTGDVRMEDVRGDDIKLDDAKMGDVSMKDIEAEGIEAEADQIDVEDMNVDNFDGGGNAKGGRVRAGSMSLVGEEGPELVAWGASGYVIPNGPSMALLSGGSAEGGTGGMVVNVTVNVGGSVMAERDLAMAVRDELIKFGKTNRNIFGGYA